MSTLTFTPIGAGSQIGANCYLAAANGHQLLLDCGVHPKIDGVEALPQFDLLKKRPEAVVVTHGHIDHCGALPYFLREYPASVCCTTKPTVTIIDRMLHNSVSVMGKVALERGIKEYPLYTHSDVDFALSRTFGVDLNEEFEPVTGSIFRTTFQHSGHVLGAAGVVIRTPDHTLYYTSDICVTNQELMQGLKFLDKSIKVDTLVIESTRGAHVDEYPKTYSGEIERFAEAANEVLNNGGCVLVPAFALGRTQELCNILVRLQRDGLLGNVPIYASGLGRAIYEVYSKFPEYLRKGTQLCPLNQFKRIGDVWEKTVRKSLLREPCIIIATSGMMLENTPSALVAMEMVQETRHGIFFAGYLDPDTLGYKVLHAQVGDSLSFELGGLRVPIKLANIQSFHFSAHAPREDLMSVIEHIQPKNLIFVHGDPEAVDWMRENCSGSYRKYAPEIGETVSLEN